MAHPLPCLLDLDESKGKTTMIVGGAMAGAGAALGLWGFSEGMNYIVFGPRSNSDDVKFYAGAALLVAGTTTFVVGLVRYTGSPAPKKYLDQREQQPAWSIALFPVRRGAAAAARFRW